MTARVRVDFTACKGHGLCAELLPEVVGLDEWGYPVLGDAAISGRLLSQARRAVAACPTLAFRISAVFSSLPRGR